jgi:ribose-phosphate pyrophosphokinase
MKHLLVSPNFQDILESNIKIGTFPDGDSNVYIPNVAKYKNSEVILCHRLYPKQNNALIELFLILSALKKINAKITIIAPYLPYARQDKVFLEGEVASAKEICQLLYKAGCQKLITFDCHFFKKECEAVYGQLPIKNISLGKELIDYIKNVSSDKNLEIIAPDEGAAYLVQKQKGKIMKKTRKLYTKKRVTYRHIENMQYDFNVKNKNILILDDMISTGSTMIKAIENLRSGGAKKIYCAATHGFFLHNSLNELEALSDGIFVSDTILSPVSKISIRKKIENIIR